MIAYMMIGVRVAELVRSESTKKEVTRYDPETGDPYLARITARKFFFCDKEVSLKRGEVVECLRSFSGEMGINLDFAEDASFHQNQDDELRSVIAGATLNARVDLEELEQVADEVAATLKGLGCNAKVSLFLVWDYSN